LSKVNVHNNWDKLEEIWLGDVWPAHFFDNDSGEVKDSFYQITEWTKDDLDAIQKKFESFDVVVRRPQIDGTKRELYTISEGSQLLRKPPICPRDTHGVIGDKIFSVTGGDPCYLPLHDLYEGHVYKKSHDVPMIVGSNIVKIGKDIIFDHFGVEDAPGSLEDRKHNVFEMFEEFERLQGSMFGSDYRLHFSTEGGHLDGCYMPVKEKLVLTTDHYDAYDTILPEWKTIGIRSPSYVAESSHKYINAISGPRHAVNKWEGNYSGMMDNAPHHFNNYVKQYCQDWIGNYKETYFEVNVVPIDENNLICIGTENKVFEKLFIELEKNGITCHPVPWRTRGFWDGGVHCITLDVRRKGELKDYFPDRGDTGIKTVRSRMFGYSTEQFFEEYNTWKLSK
jgi:hypothetical protein